VPLLIRGPGITAGSHVTQLTGNVDLAPTFEAMAGVPEPSFTDGRSLLGLAAGTAHAGRHWRSAYLVEHRNALSDSSSAQPRSRSLPLEPPDPDQGGARPARSWPRAHGHLREPRDEGVLARHEPIPNYDAVRTLRYLYVAYANGDRELYDTSTDPGEIDNLAGTMPALQHALAERVANLRECRGRGCRIAEAQQVPSGVQ
jgi:arylsulfatase A-like enzyme